MTRRAFLVALLALGGAAGMLAAGSPAGPQVTAGFYVVRPDPRLCPSPLCGGYWVALANHARTRCPDDLLRPRCYVAGAVDEQGGPLVLTIRREALVRGTVAPGRGDLGALVVARVYEPVGDSSGGRFHRLRDTGIRCVRAPCFTVQASLLNRASRTTVSEVDVGAVPVPDRESVEAALGSRTGALAQGRVAPTSDGGRVFLATRFFLASER